MFLGFLLSFPRAFNYLCFILLAMGDACLAFEQAMYRVLARYYDYIYAAYVGSAAARWADFVAELLEEVGARLVLDIACGTGAPTARLVERGFSVVCLDVNRPMLEVAMDKRLGLRSIGVFVEADAASLPFRGSVFDAATMFFSSIQYIGPFDRLVEFMRGVRSVLRRGGLFVFDASNPLHRDHGMGPVVWDVPGPNGEHLFMIDYREYESLRGIVLFKRLITIIRPDGSTRSYLTIDRVYMYTANEYRLALLQAGFRSIEVYGGYSRGEKDAASSRRIVIVARA